MQSVLITAKCKLMQVVGLIRVWCVATTPYQKKLDSSVEFIFKS